MVFRRTLVTFRTFKRTSGGLGGFRCITEISENSKRVSKELTESLRDFRGVSGSYRGSQEVQGDF